MSVNQGIIPVVIYLQRKKREQLTEQNSVEIENLKLYFPIRGGIMSRTVSYIHAVDDVSFKIKNGETFGLVGESGCGKTTLGKCILMLLSPTDGSIKINNTDLTKLKKGKLREIRSKMSMIFQDPFSSLNPRKTVADIIGQPLEIHKIAKGREKEQIVHSMLAKVGLSPDHIMRYPHEFSGGQKQRIGIARAISANPDLVIADEAVASLDVSMKAGVLNLMKELQKDLGLTYLFISHDLSIIKYICDRVAVMYLGKIVEIAETEIIFNEPLHPYTQALISAIPIPDPTVKRERIILPGTVPTPIDPPPGCRFHTRCLNATSECSTLEPELVEVKPGHFVSCPRV